MDVFQRLTDAVTPNDIIREMEKRYTNAYLMVSVNGDAPMLAKYLHYNTGNGFCFLFPHSGLQYGIPSEYLDGDITEFNPKRGWYFYNNRTAVYFKRNAYRQWRRGLSSENATLTSLSTKFHGNMFGLDTQFHLYITALMSEPDYRIDEAVVICDKTGECPITTDFLLTAHISKDSGHLLWHHQDIVGEVDVLKKIILVQNGIFWQEVLDIQQRLFPYLIVKDF